MDHTHLDLHVIGDKLPHIIIYCWRWRSKYKYEHCKVINWMGLFFLFFPFCLLFCCFHYFRDKIMSGIENGNTGIWEFIREVFKGRDEILRFLFSLFISFSLFSFSSSVIWYITGIFFNDVYRWLGLGFRKGLGDHTWRTGWLWDLQLQTWAEIQRKKKRKKEKCNPKKSQEISKRGILRSRNICGAGENLAANEIF